MPKLTDNQCMIKISRSRSKHHSFVLANSLQSKFKATITVFLTMLSSLVLHGSVGRHVNDVLEEVGWHEGWHASHVNTPWWSGRGGPGLGLARGSGSSGVGVLSGVCSFTGRSICEFLQIFLNFLKSGAVN